MGSYGTRQPGFCLHDGLTCMCQHAGTEWRNKQVSLRLLSPLPWCAGTRVPRVDLIEMGPSMDLEIRRTRQPPVDLEQEAMKQPKLTKKKVGQLDPQYADVLLWML